MQRLPFDSITGTYPVGSSAPMPHTVRPPVTRISRGAGMIVAVLGMAEVVISYRVSYRLPPTSRSAFTISGYGVSQMSVRPTVRYSPSKRPDDASSENWCQWHPTTCGIVSASRTYLFAISARSAVFFAERTPVPKFPLSFAPKWNSGMRSGRSIPSYRFS